MQIPHLLSSSRHQEGEITVLEYTRHDPLLLMFSAPNGKNRKLYARCGILRGQGQREDVRYEHGYGKLSLTREQGNFCQSAGLEARLDVSAIPQG